MFTFRTDVTGAVADVARIVLSIIIGNYLLPTAHRADAVFHNVIKSIETN